MKYETNICRLCLRLMDSATCRILDMVRLEMLKTLSPLNFSNITNVVVCSKCSDSIQRLFEFKMVCLDNNEYLKTFVNDASNVTLRLEEIVTRGTPNDDEIKSKDDVCRFCLNYFDIGSFTKINEMDKDAFLGTIIEKCLPETNLSITKEPSMCHNCLDLLQDLFNFTIACLNSDNRIKYYSSSVGTDDEHHPINLVDVLRFESELIDVKDVTLDNDGYGDVDECMSKVVVKEEELYEETGPFEFSGKMEEDAEIDSKQAPVMTSAYAKMEVNLNSDLKFEEPLSEGAPTQPSALPTIQRNTDGLYVCTHCPHQTDQEQGLLQHLLSHQGQKEGPIVDLTSIQPRQPKKLLMYHCGHCSYKSLSKSFMQRHCQTHVTLNPSTLLECEHCPYKTMQKSYFRQHNKNKHNVRVPPVQSLKCEMCPYLTKSEAILIQHLQEMHQTRIVKYECKMCGFKTHRRNHYKNHIMTKKHLATLRARDAVSVSGAVTNRPAI